ncbi:MAG: FG-GAP repeat domain-containing protein [Kiritimatiellia bacterium]
MKPFSKACRRVAIAAIAAIATAISAGEPVADADAGLGFRGMEVYRFENGTSLLHTHDLNGDGMDDIIFANNQASRLEVLIRACPAAPPGAGRAPLPTETFTNLGIVADQQIIACRTDEIYGPGRPAILTLGREQGLHIYPFQDGALLPAQKIFLQAPEQLMGLQTADLDGDGKVDIAICRKDKLELLWNEGNGRFTRRTEIPITPPEAWNVETADFTGDGLIDLMIFMADTPTLFRLRPGLGGRQFGPECILPIAPARRLKTMQGMANDPARIAGIIPSGRGLRLYKIQPTPSASFLEQDEILPVRIPLRGVNPRLTTAWAVGDFNRDGHSDCCVAAPEAGQIHIYIGNASGLSAEPLCCNTPAGASAISLTDSGDLFVFSAVEKIAALHACNRLDAFPRILPPPSPEPLIAAALPDRPEAVWICRDTTTRTAGMTFQPLAESPERTEQTPYTHPINLPNDPDAIRVWPLGNRALGIMLFIPYSPPAFYVLSTAGELVEVKSASFNFSGTALRPGMHDAQNGSMLLALNKIARKFTWEDDTWQPRLQFGSDDGNAELYAATFFRKTPDATGALFFDRHANDLLWFATGTDQPRRIHIGATPIQPIGLHPLRAGGTGECDSGLLMITDREIYVCHDTPAAFQIEHDAEYASPAEEPNLANAHLIQLGQPPRPLIAITDTRNRSLEIIERTPHGLTGRLAFTVFEDPGFASRHGGTEPREVASGDFNGDGVGDLALLVHDKLLIYLGE